MTWWQAIPKPRLRYRLGHRDDTVSMARSQIWAILAALTLVLYLLSPQYPSLVAFPQQWVLSVTPVMNGAMEAFVSLAGPLFKWIGLLFEWPIKGAQAALQLLPWSVTAACFILLGYHASGWKLALFVALSLIYMAAIGYWDESMNSLAIVLNSVPMAVTLGFAVGVWGFYSPRAERAIMQQGKARTRLANEPPQSTTR